MKFICTSDIHGYQDKVEIDKTADVIIYAGDFSSTIRNNEVESCLFLEWFNDLPIKYKILIAGNHDLYFEELSKKGELKSWLKQFYPNIIYLEDESIILEGIKIYGTPWCPSYFDWAYMKEDFELFDIFKNIDIDTEVLITHTPAYGILDYTDSNCMAGSNTLRYRLTQLPNLKYHICGHIHENAGIKEISNYANKYIAINASFCEYTKFNQPISFELI